jgi:hypothetical protein
MAWREVPFLEKSGRGDLGSWSMCRHGKNFWHFPDVLGAEVIKGKIFGIP